MALFPHGMTAAQIMGTWSPAKSFPDGIRGLERWLTTLVEEDFLLYRNGDMYQKL